MKTLLGVLILFITCSASAMTEKEYWDIHHFYTDLIDNQLKNVNQWCHNPYQKETCKGGKQALFDLIEQRNEFEKEHKPK
ncbi:hypothetical protein BN1222_03577 [Klebsiella quasipneumoniae]|uniref:hypothetical protein n=1 Tax=Klebsiella quasipneumoniae TaxID=1463165 RepID=UPI0005E9AFBB|nr:hypothetical protein [Klebsiella quasipneumoniae]CEL82315.1 hypothetical protein BN1222_03577 [Klebsiella quasipneumoniae]